MVTNATICVLAAKAGTRVLALAAEACFVLGTVRVDIALGPTIGRGADHAGHAGALTLVSSVDGGQGVGATRVGDTRVSFFHDWFNR